ncbi:MAG TPA: hypothetical protein VHW60_20850 [Caulobacteraceae bacterium]|nr:hypothetical protein [Caulobacteraceae bacterium]
MHFKLAIAAAATVLSAASAVCAAPPKDTPAAAATASVKAGDSGVTSYPPSFFAPMRPNTALDMVGDLPGFSLDTGGGVRGFGEAAGNVLINGERPATKNDSLDEIIKRIPAGSVERIDLIRGGAPGIDMQGKTVIANIIEKQDNGLHLTTALQETYLYDGKSNYGLRLEATKRIGETSFEGSLLLGTGADDGTGDGPHIVTNPAGVVTEQDLEHYFGEAGEDKATAAVETPFLGGRVRLEASYIRNPYFSTNFDYSPLPEDREFEEYKQDQDTGEVGLRYDRRFGGVQLEVYALQQLGWYASSDDLDDAGDVSTFDLTKHTGESIVRGTVTFSPVSTLQIQSGIETDYNWLDSTTTETDTGLTVQVPAADVDVRELRGEAFVDATWRARPTLTLELGGKIEASQLVSSGDVVSNQVFVFPKPRIVATWSPDKTNQLQVRLEREVSQLDFNNFVATGSLENGEHAGNPALTPQQDWVIEATYDYRFWGGGDASIAARRYWLSDVIDEAGACGAQYVLPGGMCDPNFEFPEPDNIGSGSREELSAALTLPTDRLGLKNGQLIVRATWRVSRVIDPATHLPREISGLHPVDSEMHYTQGLPSLKSTWGFDLNPAWRQTEYYFSEIDTQRLGLWADAFFEYKPRPDLSIRFEGDNLASHGLEYIRAFYFPFRDTAGGGTLTSIDGRHPRFGPELSVRIRKTFG